MLYRVGNGWSYGEGCLPVELPREGYLVCQIGDTSRASVIGDNGQSLLYSSKSVWLYLW